MAINKEELKKAFIAFEEEKYTDAKEIIKKEISAAKGEYLKNTLELSEDVDDVVMKNSEVLDFVRGLLKDAVVAKKFKMFLEALTELLKGLSDQPSKQELISAFKDLVADPKMLLNIKYISKGLKGEKIEESEDDQDDDKGEE